MHAATMQSTPAAGALLGREKLEKPSPDWLIVQGILSKSMKALDELVSLAPIVDGLNSFLLQIRLINALIRPCDDSMPKWPLIHLIEAGHQDLLKRGDAEWYCYKYGGEKAVVALYQATADDKFFFIEFDNLNHHSKVSLITRAVSKVAPYWDLWVREYQKPKGIVLRYTRISRTRKNTGKIAAQKLQQPVKRRNLEQLHEEREPAAHSTVCPPKRRRSKSSDTEGNRPDKAQLPVKSNTQFPFHPQPPTASVPEDAQCNGQTRSSPNNDASHSTDFCTLHQQQNTQNVTETDGRGQGKEWVNTPKAGSRIDGYKFDDLGVGVMQHPPTVPTLQVDYSNGSMQCPSGIDTFNFDLDASVVQHSAMVPALQVDYSNGSMQCLSGIDEFNIGSQGNSHVPFGI